MRTIYSIEPRSPLIRAAAGFLAASIALRLIWGMAWPENRSGILLYTQFLLPLLACAMFLFCLLKFGRAKLWLSFFPALLGVLFFILKAGTFVWWHRLLCTLLYLLVAVLYGMAVLGIAPIRRLLIPLFGLPLAFHLLQDLLVSRSSYTTAQWLQEGSVLGIMAALLCIALAMRQEQSTDSPAKPLHQR